jgi:hypothetical protein
MSKLQVCVLDTRSVCKSPALGTFYVLQVWKVPAGWARQCLALLDQRRERPRSDKERSCLLLLLFAVARDEGRVPAGQVTTPGVAGRPN